MTMTKIRFVTDSAADIPAELIKKWDIGVVPAYINYNGNSYADDGVELIREEYFKNLHGYHPHPTTSAMPPAVAEATLTKWFEGADHLVVITTPAKLSAINNSMRLGAQKLPQDRIHLIDSGNLCMAMGWQVLTGAEVAARTGDLQATLDAIQKVRQHSTLYAGLATIEYLRRSGRVGWAQAGLGALLQIKPILQVQDSEVASIARVRTFSRVIDTLVELAYKHAPLDKLAILHVNSLESVAELRARLKDIMPEDTITTGIGPTLGTHTGPGAIGIAPVSAAWKA